MFNNAIRRSILSIVSCPFCLFSVILKSYLKLQPVDMTTVHHSNAKMVFDENENGSPCIKETDGWGGGFVHRHKIMLQNACYWFPLSWLRVWNHAKWQRNKAVSQCSTASIFNSWQESKDAYLLIRFFNYSFNDKKMDHFKICRIHVTCVLTT